MQMEMEKELESKLSIKNNNPPNRSQSFAFRAPQENFTIQDFELGKIYGVGSYSKMSSLARSITFVWTDERVKLLIDSYYSYVEGDECDAVWCSGSRARCLEKLASVFNVERTDICPRKRKKPVVHISEIATEQEATYDDISAKLNQIGSIYFHKDKVVRAKKKDTGIVYALKIMDKKFITKENKTAYVKLERIVLDQLDHPGIIRLYFTFQDTFSLYMALESCEGGELFDQITRKGRLSEDEARFYAAEVVEALEYIHKLGLLHRDIKPENLLLTSDGHIKIADFGSVKPMQDSLITVLPNAASDDKACTFVGTAAYVPPEVLNSSPATVGNDLWALGCTLYQMLSGTSPFKDASEWLIFQRIIARDVKFPDYFSNASRDLIDQLLDIDPSRRPGAGPDGYDSLKKHPFFNGVVWDNLRMQTPPKLALKQKVHYSGGDDSHDSSWNPSHVGHVGDSSGKQSEGNNNNDSVASITRIASIDSFDSKWQQFLEPDEVVIMISMVKKLQKLTNKKVQLILTNKPKLIYVDPAKLVVKGNVMWSDNPKEMNVQVANPSNFKIVTPKKVMSFEDPKQRANQWKKAIEALQNR